ncbi:MAG: PAAR domain-containing protein, partial [Sandaracinus sp.]
MTDYVPSYATHPPSFASSHSAIWEWARSWFPRPDGSCVFTVLAAEIAERPLAILDGPPDSQGIFGVPDLVVQTALGLPSIPTDMLDVGIASLASMLPTGAFAAPPVHPGSSLHVGLPHWHFTPVPPLPGFGPTAMVGALNVLVGGMPVLRTGDVGFAPTCMGSPTFKAYTGSATVFVGGRRAARVGDLTEHCPMIRIPSGAGSMAGAFNALALLSIATSAVAHGAASVSAGVDALDAGGNEVAVEEAELRQIGEAAQATIGVAQGLADAALSAAHATIGAVPTIAGTGMGTLVPVGSLPLVMIGGLPLPDASDILAAAGRTRWGRRIRARVRLYGMRRARGRSVWCALIGHPVDAVTGRVLADHRDADLGDGLVLARRYDSSARRRSGDVGLAQRHSFERELEVWRHRVRYTDARGVVVDFPPFRGEDRVALDGYVAERLGEGRYEISFEGETMVFVASPGARAARLIAIRRPDARIDIRHDGAGRFASASIGARSLVVRRDAHGRIDRVTDARGHELASYAYEGGHLVAARDACGHEERFDHDADGRLVGWRDPRGHRFVWRYDGEGRCVHTSGQDGEWACDLAYGKNETRVTHASGLVETIRYDAYGTVLHVARSDGAFLIREQDETLRVVRERDAAGRVTELVYDADGGLAFRRDRFGNVLPPEPGPHDLSPRARVLPETYAARLGVPEEGGVPSAIAPSLEALAAWALPTPRAPRAPTLERDACARVVRAIDAEGRATTLARDASGNVVSIVDRDRRETRIEIDGWRLATRALDPIGRRVEWSYTATEEVRTYRDPRGVLTEYGRDAADRMISVTRGGRLRASYTWDAGDRLVEKRDGQGAL